MELEIKGHSGCQIEVIREGLDLFVYKSTTDRNYLQRLVDQAKKQEQASLKRYHHIHVPAIRNIIQNEQQVVIKMDYVYSRNYIEFFEQASFEQISYVTQELIDFIEKEIVESPVIKIPAKVLRDKFMSVKAHTLGNPSLCDDDEIARMMQRCGALFDNCDGLNLPIGICHGDMTFSNILFSGSNYYLIDFLDSFIESPMMDIVKLRQDTAHQWSQLMYSKRFDDVRLRIVMEKIDQDIDLHFSKKYAWYAASYQPLQLMNFLRILQYAHEPKVINYLKSTIKRLLI